MPEKTEKNREIPDRDPEKICGEFYHLRADRMGTRDPAHIRGESCGRGLENDGKNIPLHVSDLWAGSAAWTDRKRSGRVDRGLRGNLCAGLDHSPWDP